MGLNHHTKSKGDLGVAKAFADLVAQGFAVLFPATEHAPFDLVAYDETFFYRVQVKFRSATLGAVRVTFKSFWADRTGTHAVAMDKSALDVVCIYCPDTDQCYYVRPGDHPGSVSLRVSPSRNSQVAGVLPASSFRELPRAPDVCTVPGSGVSALGPTRRTKEPNMGKTLQDVMSRNPVTVEATTTLLDAAKRMREDDIGDVIVLDGGRVAGIVTDRDIVVRAVAAGKDPASCSVRDVCSSDLVTLSPQDDVKRAIDIMRQKAIRRIPVVEDGKPVGVVSIGDLAIESTGEKALADISAAKPNN